jgi:hypothetical protein
VNQCIGGWVYGHNVYIIQEPAVAGLIFTLFKTESEVFFAREIRTQRMDQSLSENHDSSVYYSMHSPGRGITINNTTAFEDVFIQGEFRCLRTF